MAQSRNTVGGLREQVGSAEGLLGGLPRHGDAADTLCVFCPLF